MDNKEYAERPQALKERTRYDKFASPEEEKIKSEYVVRTEKWTTGRHLEAEKIIFIGTKVGSIHNLQDINFETASGDTFWAKVSSISTIIERLKGGSERLITNIKRRNKMPEIIYFNGIPTIVVFQYESDEHDSPLDMMLETNTAEMRKLTFRLEEKDKEIASLKKDLEIARNYIMNHMELDRKVKMDTQMPSFRAEIGDIDHKKKKKPS